MSRRTLYLAIIALILLRVLARAAPDPHREIREAMRAHAAELAKLRTQLGFYFDRDQRDRIVRTSSTSYAKSPGRAAFR